MIDPWSPRSFAEQLADRLREKIENGEWPPGHKPPGEVTLAQTYRWREGRCAPRWTHYARKAGW